MADCSAAGTAIDRVIQSAAASSALHGSGVPAAGSSAAAAASRALGLLGGTASTASGPALAGPLGMGGGHRQVMPTGPLGTLGGGGQHAMQQAMRSSGGLDASRMDAAWASSSSGGPSMMTSHGPMHHQVQGPMHHHMAGPQMMQAGGPQAAMMMQQQSQMMMMQQMQMQQAAMVQMQAHQQQAAMAQRHQQQQTAAARQKAAAEATSTAQEADLDDDVATVSEEEAGHEGLTDDADMERLAAAWREAEAEFASEFDDGELDGEYDASDMGAMFNEEAYGQQQSSSAVPAGARTDENGEPAYEFSEASRTHGCLTTPSTDLAPNPLDYPDNLFEEGMRHFDDGNIPEAVLCFESALRNVDPEHADAWRMLGRCHAESDEDSRAIVCWLRSLERDPYSSETMLALGVAYVNELDHERAIESLRGWVANHPLYAGVVADGPGAGVEDDPYGDGGDALPGMRPGTVSEMRDVERLLLRALDVDRTADAAADVYEALGVVYNVSRDYDAAASAFRRAIEVRPGDYQLRNKLGATLANGNRSEEALPEYRSALGLKPKYARGWLNMAIGHSNLRNYSEAARCYLQTLSLNPDARHVWSYLRVALTCDERWDLLPMAASQDLGGFREHFDFVSY